MARVPAVSSAAFVSVRDQVPGCGPECDFSDGLEKGAQAKLLVFIFDPHCISLR
jgi:hypothetical protein